VPPACDAFARVRPQGKIARKCPCDQKLAKTTHSQIRVRAALHYECNVLPRVGIGRCVYPGRDQGTFRVTACPCVRPCLPLSMNSRKCRTSSATTRRGVEVMAPERSLHLMILIQHLLAPSSTLEFSHVKPSAASPPSESESVCPYFRPCGITSLLSPSLLHVNCGATPHSRPTHF
jgi:hypothetical protein